MIVPTAEGSGTVVLSTPASSSKDEMTIGGLYVIDGIDVVATLVPEEDVWQFEATETCTTETQMQDREQESVENLWKSLCLFGRLSLNSLQSGINANSVALTLLFVSFFLQLNPQ